MLLESCDECVTTIEDAQVRIPLQIEISENALLEEIERSLADNEMEYPLLIKPKWADGRPGCHNLGFVQSSEGLNLMLNQTQNTMKPPFIAQQVIPHDSVIFKV